MTQELARAILAALLTLSGSLDSQQQQVQQLAAIVRAAIPPDPVPVPTPLPTAPNVLVTTAAQLQMAIDTDQGGSTIRLAPGRYVGPIVLRNHPGTAVTTITTDGTIPVGRIQPGTPLAVICSSSTDAPLRTDAGAHHYALVGLEVCEVNGGYASVAVGTNEETAIEQFPHHLTFDRIRITGIGQQRRGVMAIGGSIVLKDSAITGIKFSGEDSQAVWLNGPGPYVLDNNNLEGAGENLLVGGADPKVPMLVPTDITITRNWLHKPLAWRGTATTVKNLLELKNAKQVRISGNLLENVWQNGQSGYAVLFTPRNQEGTCPWCIVEDVIFEKNLVRHAGGAVNVLGRDDEKPSQLTNRIRIQQNAFLDIGSAWASGGYVFMVGAGPTGVVFDHNTVRTASARGLLTAYGAPSPGFVFTANLAPSDAYGVFGDGTGTGTAAITKYFPGGVLTQNVLAGALSAIYPASFGIFPTLATFNGRFTTSSGGVQIATSDWLDRGVPAAALLNEATVINGR